MIESTEIVGRPDARLRQLAARLCLIVGGIVFALEVAAKQAKFLVVTGSMGIQVSPDSTMRQAYMNRLGVRNLYYPEQRIKALGDQEGFKVLNLAPVLEEYASRNKMFLHGAGESMGKGHWNETGHRLAGQLIAQEICNAGL